MILALFYCFFDKKGGYKKDIDNRSHHDDAASNISQCQNWRFSDLKL